MRENKMEADDIIAIITKYLSNKKENTYLLNICDEDFKQLGNEHVNFIDYRTKKIKVLSKRSKRKFTK